MHSKTNPFLNKDVLREMRVAASSYLGLDLDQKGAASYMGVSTRNYQRMEAGQKGPSVSMVRSFWTNILRFSNRKEDIGKTDVDSFFRVVDEHTKEWAEKLYKEPTA